ncbi:hypothetical protein MSAN_00708100 [Mycena sanguinolenta]|uniref:RING-type E3 ubiquitin transferase n=1 Tax=Mycena sanguinolenta TaxID=230812 RepID=A0A8H6Z1Y4_9AGAR|nr:hypothetical protein MSAN_00708100 [Mycena sanguinolenta]
MSSESAAVSSRPVTSKSRGICKYYNTERGCFAPPGKCKFLHGPDATHTPYDQAKTCRFYAAGFCKRGAKCWFIHTKGKEKAVETDEEDDLCSICFDKPDTYGLLTDCSHIFCITCIKQWRDPANKSIDVVDSGNTKRCPMCRGSSKFIIPSSKFYPQGEAKDAALARYMDSMKRVPCKHFQKSLASGRGTPFCPFGKDCFYQHRNPDGTDYISILGIDDARIRAQRQTAQFGLPEFHRAGLIRQLESVFAQSASLGLGPRLPGLFDEGLDDSALIRRRLEILADQMLASLTAQDPHSDSEGPSDEEDEAMPPLERVDAPRRETRIFPEEPDSGTDGEMPALASVSDSSDSAPSSDEDDDDEEDDNYSNTLDPGDAPYDRIQTVRPFDLVFDPGMDAHDAANNRGVFMRLRSFLDDFSRSGPSTPTAESSTRAVNTPTADPPVPLDTAAEEDDADADDESDMPPLEREPPFVTDGRGRVVWSSSSDSGTGQQGGSSGPRRASVSFPGAFPPASSSAIEKPPSPRQTTAMGEGGFTTDGRGRVIGTTGTREDAEDSGSSTTEEAPIQTRSFFGRVLDAFF